MSETEATAGAASPGGELSAQTPRVIVITGANSGLGRALAVEFLRLGHIIHGCGRRAERVAENNAMLAAAAADGQVNAAESSFTAIDVTDEAAVQQWAGDICSRTHGAPTLLINNAGRGSRPTDAWDIPTSEFEGVLQVNVVGIHNCVRAFVPFMIAAHTKALAVAPDAAASAGGNGVIVNLSSGMGRSANPNTCAYTASKWAVEGMTKCLALGLPKGMIAVPLGPGVIATENCKVPFAHPVEKWAAVTAPMLLGLDESQNGHSLTSPGFYQPEFIETWLIPDGCGLPSKIFGPPRRKPSPEKSQSSP